MKDWTVLIYSNGNNEMEPEMYESILNCEKVGSSSDINIIMQLSRADRRIAQIMRPDEIFPEEFDQWTGVRRYYISKSNSILLESLENINMADPINLYEFIKWGIENYPSKHYMIALGGHGISFIGNMTDLTHGQPYIMGTPEMCKAIELINVNIGVKIDILILDMCYMNSIEVIYEFGKNKDNGVKNILTYIDVGPFKGLPYDIIISTVQKYSSNNNLNKLLKEIINNLGFETIAFEINYEKLENIKNKFSDLAYCYLNNKENYKIEPFNLLNKKDPLYPWFNIINDLEQSLKSIIIHYKENNNGNTLIKVISEELGDLYSLYCKLAFSKNNYWLHLLCGMKAHEKIDNYMKFDLKPMKLSDRGILHSILTMNPNLTIEQAQLILNEIQKYKS